MKTCVIMGAGLSGLVAARHLRSQGWRTLVVDKGRQPGGRLATRRVGGISCDHGGQFLTVRDPAFAALVEGWERAGLVRRWCLGFPVLTPAGLQVPDGHPRWCAVDGFRALGAALAADLEVRQEATVVRLEAANGGGWHVVLVPGDAVRSGPAGPEEVLYADAVISTIPGPQAASLVAASGYPVPAALQAVRYHPCHALMVAWAAITAPVLPEPGGLRVEDPAQPVGWMASQRSKGLTSTGDVLLVHATGPWSAAHEEDAPETVMATLLASARMCVARAGGIWPTEAMATSHHRWRYSLPRILTEDPVLAIDAPAPLLLAGDAFGGRPRIEGAALSGLAAAQRLVGA